MTATIGEQLAARSALYAKAVAPAVREAFSDDEVERLTSGWVQVDARHGRFSRGEATMVQELKHFRRYAEEGWVLEEILPA